MREVPEYSITEFALAALCFAASISFFIWAAHSLALSQPFRAAEGFGGGLMLLSGCADPKKHIIDCLTFPLSIAESAGRDTPLTILATYLGLTIWLIGMCLDWLSG